MSGDLPAPDEVDALTRSTDELRTALSNHDADGLLRRPAPGEWSAWDIAYHVAQIEIWYVAKLCEAASADAPEAMQRFLDAWRGLRQCGVALARGIPTERLDVSGLLSGVEDWTPRQLLERIAAHDREHAAQARGASARRTM